MGTISKQWYTPGFQHFRGRQIAEVVRFKKGKFKAPVQGDSFLFRPRNTQIVEVPIDDQELPFSFPSRTADHQEVVTLGAITYRVRDVLVAFGRVDFSINLATGDYEGEPEKQLDSLITELAQQGANAWLTQTPVDTVLTDGVARVRAAITDHFAEDPTLEAMGIELVGVRIASVRPTSAVEKALQIPTFEALSKKSDAATFERRSEAVSAERAIAEAEGKNAIAAAEQQGDLIDKQSRNAVSQTSGRVQAENLQRVANREAILADNETKAQATLATAEAEAGAIDVVEAARIDAEKERAAIANDMDPARMWALAGQELAKNLHQVGNIIVTPEMISKFQSNGNLDEAHA